MHQKDRPIVPVFLLSSEIELGLYKAYLIAVEKEQIDGKLLYSSYAPNNVPESIWHLLSFQFPVNGNL